MSSKSKRQLKFLDKEKRNKLKEKITSGKQYYAKEFEQHFLKCYQSYLEHFPCRKTLFDAAVKMEHFVMFTELLLLHISDIFSECNRKSNKYAQFQMSWYTFSGKVLNYNTGIIAIDNILSRYIESLRKVVTVKGIDTEGDIRIYLSCLLKSLLDFFLHITYKLKTSSHQTQVNSNQTQVKIDISSIYRIAGANLMRMIKKRKSTNFLKRLTKRRQSIIQEEISLLQNLHYPNEEKQNTELPPGVRYLDRGSLLIVKKPIFNFVKIIIKNVCGSVSTQSYNQLGLRMTQVAKLKVCDRQTKSMFCACVKLAAGNVSLQAQNVHLLCSEYSTKIFNTVVNEYIKRDKFMQKNNAQLMLRDKLKFFASQSQKYKSQKPKSQTSK